MGSEQDTMNFPAAPREWSKLLFAPRSTVFLSSASPRPMNRRSFPLFRALFVVVGVGLMTNAAFGITKTPTKRTRKKTVVHAAAVSVRTSVRPIVATAARTRKKVWVQTWDEPTYKDSTANDKVDGEDLIVRKAAVDALGPLNGSIVVVDPTSGRILTMVNQPLALGGGFQPCSTIKVSVALAALREGLVERTSPVRFYSKRSADLTDALAYSNNSYFANLGIKLGYERVNYYAHLFGYGEKAGLNVEGEHPGAFPPGAPEERRHGYVDELRRRDFTNAFGTGRLNERHRQRRNAVLAAVSTFPGRNRQFSAADQTAPGYRPSHRADQAWHERRG